MTYRAWVDLSGDNSICLDIASGAAHNLLIFNKSVSMIGHRVVVNDPAPLASGQALSTFHLLLRALNRLDSWVSCTAAGEQGCWHSADGANATKIREKISAMMLVKFTGRLLIHH